MKNSTLKFSLIKLFSILPVLCLSLISTSLYADWSLDNSLSTLNFVSIKKSSIAEVHHFSELSGQLVKKSGKAKIEINLASVETLIPIRNERLQSLLFNTSTFPTATITADFSSTELAQLKLGESQTKSQTLVLDLHGISRKMTAFIKVTKLSNNKIGVASIKPIILKANDFNLVEGIKALQTIANLPSIATQIPVSFDLVFVKP